MLCVFRAALTHAQGWFLLIPDLPPLCYHTCWYHLSGGLLMSKLHHPAQSGG